MAIEAKRVLVGFYGRVAMVEVGDGGHFFAHINALSSPTRRAQRPNPNQADTGWYSSAYLLITQRTFVYSFSSPAIRCWKGIWKALEPL